MQQKPVDNATTHKGCSRYECLLFEGEGTYKVMFTFKATLSLGLMSKIEVLLFWMKINSKIVSTGLQFTIQALTIHFNAGKQ